MADVDELRRVLEPHTEADVTVTFKRFRETMRSEDVSQFVGYMVDQGLLPPESAPHVIKELRASDEPTLIEPRSDSRRSAGSGSGPKPDLEWTAPDANAAHAPPKPRVTHLELFEVI